jgi:hypothetical protein
MGYMAMDSLNRDGVAEVLMTRTPYLTRTATA